MPSFVDALNGASPVYAVELRPPRAELSAAAGMDAWIDTYHSVRRLVRRGHHVCLTDSAVGAQEEDNLRHLVLNLGDDVPRDHVVPFLTSKHTLQYCLAYADRAQTHGFPSLVVLGGDKAVGTPRSVEHAWQLRAAIRARQPSLALGGWANPHRHPERQVEFLQAADFTGEFYLTQVASHHQVQDVERFLAEASRRDVTMPGVFGVFYYRSARRRTLDMLAEFMPVPVAELVEEFGVGASANTVCARTIRTLRAAGVRHFYISNLPLIDTDAVLHRILDEADQ
ncbi:MAG: hypothetical protein H0V80_08685 [Acidobacteria bacterium]|nr:hypothetical protein [Acidobacteriota bacterium]